MNNVVAFSCNDQHSAFVRLAPKLTDGIHLINICFDVDLLTSWLSASFIAQNTRNGAGVQLFTSCPRCSKSIWIFHLTYIQENVRWKNVYDFININNSNILKFFFQRPSCRLEWTSRRPQIRFMVWFIQRTWYFEDKNQGSQWGGGKHNDYFQVCINSLTR